MDSLEEMLRAVKIDPDEVTVGPTHWETLVGDDGKRCAFTSAKIKTEVGADLWFHLQCWDDLPDDLWVLLHSPEQLKTILEGTSFPRTWLEMNNIVAIFNIYNLDQLVLKWSLVGSVEEIALNYLFTSTKPRNIF
jgi:hypothetical protein